MQHENELKDLLSNDPRRLQLLRLAQSLELPDCWLAAGVIRSAVWDQLHGRPPTPPDADVDVIWFGLEKSHATDVQLQLQLRKMDAGVRWSVKNQRRMNVKNHDAPYASSCDAMRFWPETATAVGVQWRADGDLRVCAPFGLRDLFTGVLRPGPRFLAAKRVVFESRVTGKNWLKKWPKLRMLAA